MAKWTVLVKDDLGTAETLTHDTAEGVRVIFLNNGGQAIKTYVTQPVEDRGLMIEE